MMNIRLHVVGLLAVCILLTGLSVQYAAAQSFPDANQLYKDNKYDQAVDTYEKLVRAGSESGDLYYNLGNGYFKKGDLGRAILNYERAKIFIPHDSDLRSNYDFVRSVLNVPSRYSSEVWFFRWLDRLFDGIGMDMLTVLVSGLWFSVIVLMSAALFLSGFRHFAPALAVILVVLLILCSAALGRKINYYEHGAIVTGREVEVKFEPADGATTYFKLNEGNPVFILDRSTGWIKIRRPDSKIGWVSAGNISAIRERPGNGPL